MLKFAYLPFLILFLVVNTTQAKTYKIETRNRSNGHSMTFEPSFLKIEIGDKVEFIPKDKGHNSQSVFTPKDAKPWKGKPGKKVIVSFDKEGVYIYECINHFIMGMNGVIQVGAATNIKEAGSFVKKYKKKVAIKKNRIDEVFKNVK